MDSFVAGSALVAMAPIIFTARAWWILHHDPSHNSGRLARVVLYLNSASALLFVATILSSERLTQLSVWRMSVPMVCLSICITVLSGLKNRRPLYRAVFISSGILSAGWLIIGSLH
ncbi:MAG: hypothetical protein JSS95_15575 [Acidobacteria bacterium]|nr:hypothetical protein [Acidobacteriota bacterium]